MDYQLSEDDIRLFLEECDELLQQLEQDLLELERTGDGAGLMDGIFRAAHTLKGSAATLGHQAMAEFTHRLEDLLSKLRSGELAMSQEIGNVLFASLDVLHEFRDEVERGESGHVEAGPLLAELARLGGEDAPASATGPAAQVTTAVATAAPAAPSLAALASPVAATAAEAATAIQPLDVPDLDFAAFAVGQVAWHIGLDLDPNGQMPAVRAFQALLAAEGWGEVLRSEPSRDMIEAEQIGSTLALLVAGGGNMSALREALEAVPEVSITRFEPATPDEVTELAGARAAAEQATTPVPAGATQDAGAAAEASATAEASAPETAATPARSEQSSPAQATQAAARRGAGASKNSARTVRVAVDLLDNLMNLVGELVIDRTRLTSLVGDLGPEAGDVAAELGQTSSHIGRVTTDLQEQIMRARMLPVENLFRKFPRMVRDLAQSQGKQVELIVRGEETELDRSILEEIADPLLHLLRNAVDHAIEPAAERMLAGKEPTGRIWLEAAHEEGSIVISVRDDGRGMDPVRIGEKAVARGIVTEEQLARLDDHEVLELLMTPGFSLAEQVTDVSGRGVGMDVVRSNIERINGTVSLQSTVGVGSEIRIRLPLTLAIIQALLVRVGGETYALPLSAVLEAAVVSRDAVRNVQNQEFMSLRGEVIPLIRLRRLFGLDGESPDEMPVVIVSAGHRQAGLVVDLLEGEQEIVVKNLGPLGQMTPGLAGATILGDGGVALILDVAALLPTNRNKEDIGDGYHLAG